jgi:hypothetical protein
VKINSSKYFNIIYFLINEFNILENYRMSINNFAEDLREKGLIFE